MDNLHKNYLEHHGILGMRWGRKMGPPYPLDASDHSAAEKKEGYKKSLGGGRNESLYDRKEKKASSSKTESKVVMRRKGSDAKSYEKFNNSKEAKAAKKKAYDRTLEYFKEKDPEYLEKITKENGGKTEGLEKFQDFRDKFDAFDVDEWDKAEKEFNKSPTKEERENERTNKNLDAFNKEYAKAREKGEMTKELIKKAGKVEYDRAYERYSKTMSDPDKIHEKAKADQKAVEDYIRVNGMDEYVRPDKKGMKEKAKNYQNSMNQLQLNENRLALKDWELRDNKDYVERLAKTLKDKDPIKNKEKINNLIEQSKILDKKINEVASDASKNRVLIDALLDKMDKDEDIVYRTRYMETGAGGKDYLDYSKLLTDKYGKTSVLGGDGGYHTVSGTAYKVAAGTDRNKNKKKYTDSNNKKKYAHRRTSTYYYYY